METMSPNIEITACPNDTIKVAEYILDNKKNKKSAASTMISGAILKFPFFITATLVRPIRSIDKPIIITMCWLPNEKALFAATELSADSNPSSRAIRQK
jgi:hypothetical protein